MSCLKQIAHGQRVSSAPALTEAQKQAVAEYARLELPNLFEQIVPCCMMILAFGVSLNLDRWVGPHGFWSLAIMITILAPAWWAFALWRRRRMYCRALAKAGIICKRCAYSFHGLAATVRRCPECGAGRTAIN